MRRRKKRIAEKRNAVASTKARVIGVSLLKFVNWIGIELRISDKLRDHAPKGFDWKCD